MAPTFLDREQAYQLVTDEQKALEAVRDGTLQPGNDAGLKERLAFSTSSLQDNVAAALVEETGSPENFGELWDSVSKDNEGRVELSDLERAINQNLNEQGYLSPGREVEFTEADLERNNIEIPSAETAAPIGESDAEPEESVEVGAPEMPEGYIEAELAYTEAMLEPVVAEEVTPEQEAPELQGGAEVDRVEANIPENSAANWLVGLEGAREFVQNKMEQAALTGQMELNLFEKVAFNADPDKFLDEVRDEAGEKFDEAVKQIAQGAEIPEDMEVSLGVVMDMVNTEMHAEGKLMEGVELKVYKDDIEQLYWQEMDLLNNPERSAELATRGEAARQELEELQESIRGISEEDRIEEELRKNRGAPELNFIEGMIGSFIAPFMQMFDQIKGMFGGEGGGFLSGLFGGSEESQEPPAQGDSQTPPTQAQRQELEAALDRDGDGLDAEDLDLVGADGKLTAEDRAAFEKIASDLGLEAAAKEIVQDLDITWQDQQVGEDGQLVASTGTAGKEDGPEGHER